MTKCRRHKLRIGLSDWRAAAVAFEDFRDRRGNFLLRNRPHCEHAVSRFRVCLFFGILPARRGEYSSV
jgi:hypothetical protein